MNMTKQQTRAALQTMLDLKQLPVVKDCCMRRWSTHRGRVPSAPCCDSSAKTMQGCGRRNEDDAVQFHGNELLPAHYGAANVTDALQWEGESYEAYF
eukprot:402427-Amphidinium_carterae.2